MENSNTVKQISFMSGENLRFDEKQMRSSSQVLNFTYDCAGTDCKDCDCDCGSNWNNCYDCDCGHK